jgi:uncharacterized protein YqeY
MSWAELVFRWEADPLADSIKDRLEQDLKTAMRAGDVPARETIRFTLAALKNAQIDKRAPLDPAEEMDVLKSQAKRRADSIEQFAKAGRADLVAREQGQLTVLQRYLPQELDDSALADLVQRVIDQVGATGPRDMGKVMPIAIREAGDSVSGRRLSEAVRTALAARA